MTRGFMPNTDSGLLQWSQQFAQKIALDPEAYGITPAQSAELSAAQASYAENYQLALAPKTRTRVAVAEKNHSRSAFKRVAKRMAAVIDTQANVSDPQRVALGLNVRGPRRRIGKPQTAPRLQHRETSGNTMRLQVIERGTATGAKPSGVIGAIVFSYCGSQPPETLKGWDYQCMTSRNNFKIKIPAGAQPGEMLWFAAAWINTKLQRGPMSKSLSTYVQYGMAPRLAA